MSTYKCVIANRVAVPVRFDINDAGKNQHHSFTLFCERLSQDELASKVEANMNFKEEIKKFARGWEGQRVVVTEDNSPADFNEDSLEMLLSIAGIHQVIWIAYMKEVGAKVKN